MTKIQKSIKEVYRILNVQIKTVQRQPLAWREQIKGIADQNHKFCHQS